MNPGTRLVLFGRRATQTQLQTFIGGEPVGFAMSFMDDTSANQIVVKSGSGVAYSPADSFITQANVVVPPLVYDALGNRVFAPHNLFINSETPATQNVTTVIGETYTVTVTGSGTMTISGAGVGVASAGSPFTFTATTTTATCTKASTPTRIQMNRGSTATAYLASGSSARYGVAIDHDPVTHAPLGMRTDPSRTQYLLNNMTPATQTVSLPAATYTTWMEGTGSVTLSGGPTNVVTDGSPATFTLASTTSVTFTVAGTVNVFQCETGSSKTALLRTLGVAAGRSANAAEMLFSQIPALGTEYSVYVDFVCTDFTSGTQGAIRMRNSSDTEQLGIRGLTAGSGSMNAVASSSSVSKTYGTLVAGQRAQVTARVKGSSILVSQDGIHPNQNTGIFTLATPPAPDRMYLGEGTNGSIYIRRLLIVPRALGEGEIGAWRYTYTTDPTKYRIIMLAGQSNLLNGQTLNAGIDIAGPNNYQINQSGVVSAANEPLQHPSFIADGIGFAAAFARDYLVPSGRLATGEQVLLVPCGIGATGFSNTRWGVGNDLYCNAIGLTARAKAMFPNSTVDAIFWMQGETDVAPAMTGPAYQSALDATLQGMRNQLGGTGVKIVVGGMSPLWVAADTANRQAIANVHADTPNRFTNCAYADPNLPSQITDTQNAFLHYSAVGQRTFSGRWWTAYQGL
jgi:hypothetical protein